MLRHGEMMAKIALKDVDVKKVLGGVAIVACGIGLFTLYKYYKAVDKDEYFTRASWSKSSVGEASNRRVLILGLDGAGKTRLIRCFRRGASPTDVVPSADTTIGFNVQSVIIDGLALDMWDVGGSIACRDYWREFLLNIDVLVWVVDAANPLRFQESRQALHTFLEHQKTRGIPIVVVAAKQDMKYAVDPHEVLEEMRVMRFEHQHVFRCTGTQIPSKGNRQGIRNLFNLISSI